VGRTSIVNARGVEVASVSSAVAMTMAAQGPNYVMEKTTLASAQKARRSTTALLDSSMVVTA